MGASGHPRRERGVGRPGCHGPEVLLPPDPAGADPGGPHRTEKVEKVIRSVSRKLRSGKAARPCGEETQKGSLETSYA